VQITQKAIFGLMREITTITAKRIADALGISKRRVESRMKETGFLERVGLGKSGHWVVVHSVIN